MLCSITWLCYILTNVSLPIIFYCFPTTHLYHTGVPKVFPERQMTFTRDLLFNNHSNGKSKGLIDMAGDAYTAVPLRV